MNNIVSFVRTPRLHVASNSKEQFVVISGSPSLVDTLVDRLVANPAITVVHTPEGHIVRCSDNNTYLSLLNYLI